MYSDVLYSTTCTVMYCIVLHVQLQIQVQSKGAIIMIHSNIFAFMQGDIIFRF